MSSNIKPNSTGQKQRVKVKTTELEFNDQKEYEFWNYLVKSKQFPSVLSFLFSKVYNNLDFFLNEKDMRVSIEDYYSKKSNNSEVEQFATNVENSLDKTVSQIEGLLLNTVKQNQQMNSELAKKLNNVSELVVKFSEAQKSTQSLATALEEIKSSLSENKEAMSKLSEIKISGDTLEELISKSRQADKVSTSIISEMKEVASTTVEEFVPSSNTNPTSNNQTDEVVSQGTFESLAKKRSAVDMKALRKKMKGNN